MVRAQTRTDDDARGSHLSIPGIRIFRMNGLHRCVNNNANRFPLMRSCRFKASCFRCLFCDRRIRCIDNDPVLAQEEKDDGGIY